MVLVWWVGHLLHVEKTICFVYWSILCVVLCCVVLCLFRVRVDGGVVIVLLVGCTVL